MRKIFITLITTVLLITGIALPVFSDTYVPSIGVREDVILDSNPVIEEPDGCREELIVTPYLNKADILSGESKQQMDEAYVTIVEAKDVSELTDEIVDVAHDLGAEVEDLVVRDLFDVTMYHVEISDNHVETLHIKNVGFTIEAHDLDNFVALLVYHDGKWHLVDDVEVLKDQDLINVISDELSPFAIITATNYRYVATAHGCIWHLFICITMIITYLLMNIIRRKGSETRDKKKKNIFIRDLLCIISLILCIIFYIFGTCKYDIYALIVELTVLLVAFVYSHPYNSDDEY